MTWSLKNLVAAYGMSLTTMQRFELRPRKASPDALAAYKVALEAEGVKFIPENGD